MAKLEAFARGIGFGVCGGWGWKRERERER